MNSFSKVVVIGPESTGKSTLCKQLANHYNTLWVPEFAREYLEKNGTDYSYENLLTIAKEQVCLEDQYIKRMENLNPETGSSAIQQPLLFIDTDMYVMKIWCEFVFDKCPNWILNQIATRQYDLYLLCNVDLPWTKDALREYPDFEIRDKLYHYYKDVMINQPIPWVEISGDYYQRIKKAVDRIDSLIS